MPRTALIMVAGLLALAACEKKAKLLDAPELVPLLEAQAPVSRALELVAVREDLIVRMGGREDMNAVFATTARYGDAGVTDAELGSLKVEVGFLAQRYFDKLETEIETVPTWPAGDKARWRQRARLALASTRRDFAFQFGADGDLGGALRGTDDLHGWMRGEARPIHGPRRDRSGEQLLAIASVAPDTPRRPGPSQTLSSGPPTALAIPAPSSQ